MKDKIHRWPTGSSAPFAESDSDMANLFKSGEVVLADGGRGTAEQINDGGGDVTWVAPKEGTLSWVCGLGHQRRGDNIDAAYCASSTTTSRRPRRRSSVTSAT